MLHKVCAMCGKEFDTKYPHQKYCSKGCEREQERRTAKAYREKQGKGEHRAGSDSEWYAEVNKILRKAKKYGMSYGKYVAAKEAGLI